MSGRNARIRYIRKALDLTQEEFAPLVGIHRVTLAKIERGIPATDGVAKKIDEYIEGYDRTVKQRRTA